MLGPFRLVLRKKAFGSELYIPWKDAWEYALNFWLKSWFRETPYCSVYCTPTIACRCFTCSSCTKILWSSTSYLPPVSFSRLFDAFSQPLHVKRWHYHTGCDYYPGGAIFIYIYPICGQAVDLHFEDWFLPTQTWYPCTWWVNSPTHILIYSRDGWKKDVGKTDTPEKKMIWPQLHQQLW